MRAEKFPRLEEFISGEPGSGGRTHSKRPGKRTVSQFIARAKQTGSWREWTGGDGIGRP